MKLRFFSTARLSLPLACAIAAAVPAQAALVARYQFEETAGTVLVDSSGNGFNGSVVGAGGSLNVAGTVGSAYQPGSAIDSYGTVANGVNAFGMGGNSARTLSLWFNTSSFGIATTQNRLIGMGASSGAGVSFDIVAENGSNGGPANRVGLRYGNGNVYFDADNSGTAFATNTWYHLAAVYDGTTLDLESIGTASDGVGLTFYVNGARVNTAGGNLGNGTQVLGTTLTAVNFGATAAGTNALYPGLLDDVQVYNEALSASQVASLFNNPGSVIPEPGVLGLSGLGFLLLLRRRR